MAALLHRPDIDNVRDRLTRWWNGGDIGRPVLQIHTPRAEPLEAITEIPRPADVTAPWYTMKDYDYRLSLHRRTIAGTHCLGEAVPVACPETAPNALALFLGCPGVEGEDTVWCEPIFDELADARFEVDEANPYWQFTLRFIDDMRRLGEGKFLLGFPDLIEGLDTLAAMRDSQDLLIDMMDDPDRVHDCLRQITDRYFHYYDILYDLEKDETGGSWFWAWAPGRMCKLQCDFSAMISPAMFEEFMVPVLRAMTSKLDHCMYHWDGPGAICHHDHLLGLENLDMIQWTPGSGVERATDRRWWPLFHKTIEAGKKVFLVTECPTQADRLEVIASFKKEFGEGFGHFLLCIGTETLEQADELIKAAEM